MTPFEHDILKILLDKLLIGVLFACIAFYISRLVEQHRVKLAYRQNLTLQRLEASKALTSLLGEFHRQYNQWLDELEGLARKIDANSVAPGEVTNILGRWNAISAALTGKESALIGLVPLPLAERFKAYVDIANRMPGIFKAGPQGI